MSYNVNKINNKKTVTMKKILRSCIFAVMAIALLPAGTLAQERRDKDAESYVLEHPYEVTKITPPQGKKIKNVILMIGDGMSLMHVYSAWTANRGKLFLDNCQNSRFVREHTVL